MINLNVTSVCKRQKTLKKVKKHILLTRKLPENTLIETENLDEA